MVERFVSPVGSKSASARDYPVATFRRNRLQDATIWGAVRVAAGLHGLFGDRADDAFGILMYHRVAERTGGISTPTANVTPLRFREQLQGLLQRGFLAWSLQKILQTLEAGGSVPANVFAVTFDDGYENNLVHALPILEDLQIPATIYIATAFLDSDRPFPFDNWDGCGEVGIPDVSWRPLSTMQCRELADHPLIELGAHTHTHGAFLDSASALKEDLAVNLAILRDQFGVERPTFAYPYGAICPEMVEAIRQLDVAAALTTRAERIRSGADRYTWGRFTADQRDTAATLAAKLGGWYEPIATMLRTVKRPLSAMTPGGLGELVVLPRRDHSLPQSVMPAA
jgi:peptidoglycan/xylan/chitin deacetylase (PgdA/CDA1 family)